MSGFSDPILTGSGNLIRVTEQSDNFVHGSTGWQLTRAGDFEANNGTFRGTLDATTFEGTDFVINTSGAFFYGTTPGPGTLIASIAPASGTDAYGNAYQAGFAVYNSTFISAVDNVNTSSIQIEASSGLQTISILPGGSFTVGNPGLNCHQADGILHITAPQITGDGGSGCKIVMSPANPANAGNATIALTADAATWDGQNILAVGAWTALTLGSSWQDGNSTSNGYAPAYRMVGKNRIELRGTIQPNPAGSLPNPSIVTGALPAGARPSRLVYGVTGSGLTTTTQTGRFRVNTSGDLQFNYLGATAPGFFSLDGIAFDLT